MFISYYAKKPCLITYSKIKKTGNDLIYLQVIDCASLGVLASQSGQECGIAFLGSDMVDQRRI